ncbi:aldo/keto reductase [Halobaculum sp. EA56]|uniref:aldo/keto reductase n=1 Tax=Halobaculum sp. EA56 TaxID=3421648 RepID=UPI003EB93EBE
MSTDVIHERTERDDTPLPPVGFGTYRMGGYECYNAVRRALDAGYRHIDTAMAYENEAVVGRALEASDVDRDDVFLTTKVKGYPELLEYDRLIEAAEGCLDRLGVDRVDLLLVHWWNPVSDMEEVFAAMDRLVAEGAVDHVGVSNFSADQLRRAMAAADEPILTNQVEYHPYWADEELLSFCRANDVTLTAYSPLAEGRVVNDETLAAIGARYGKSPAQVAIRWLTQQDGVVTIPKTVTPERMRENLDVFDFSLSDREMDRIADLEGPLWYRANLPGGPVHRLRGHLGELLPNTVVNRVAGD